MPRLSFKNSRSNEISAVVKSPSKKARMPGWLLGFCCPVATTSSTHLYSLEAVGSVGDSVFVESCAAACVVEIKVRVSKNVCNLFIGIKPVLKFSKLTEWFFLPTAYKNVTAPIL